MTGFGFRTIAAVLASMAMSVFLWRYWTPRCNEACPVWVGLSMYATLLAIPLFTVAAVTLRRMEKWSRQTMARLLLVACVAAGAWIAFLTVNMLPPRAALSHTP